MPAQQQHSVTTAYLSGTTGPVTVGYVLCLNDPDADEQRYVVSSSANRAAFGRRSAGIALDDGDDFDPAVEMQTVGVVPPAISGLLPGVASIVRVSTAGRLERVASYSPSDDACGYCDADGTAYVCFPLVGMSFGMGGGGTPAGVDRSVQYNGGGAFAGASHASISNDGHLEIAADATGGPASYGDFRLPDQWYIVSRDAAASSERTVGRGFTYAGAKSLILGGDGNDIATAFDEGLFVAKAIVRIVAGVTPGIGYSATIGPIGSGGRRFVYVQPNFAIARAGITAASDPFNGGLGMLHIYDQETDGTDNPINGLWMRSNPSNHHLEVKLPSGGWIDLTP